LIKYEKIKTIINIAMTKKIRTKKNRKYRKKNKSLKIGGADANTGVNSGTAANTGVNSGAAADELKKKIEEEHSLSNLLPDLPNFGLGDSQVTNKVVDLSEGVALKTIDGAANILGVDLNNSEKFNEKLEDIKNVLDDPKNKELVKDIAGEVSEIGVVALEAAKPFTNELITEVFDKLKVVGDEFGQTGVKVALNTLEEIPGYGVIVGTIRSASNIGEAVLASTNATAEVVTKTSDTINASLQNFDNLLKEKGDLIDRTTESINKFSENMKSMPTSVGSPNADTPAVSGGSRKNKRRNKKTKKVRFNL
jgi:hypothetical protein